MRKQFVEDVLKSPGKLVALCCIVYLATMSFFVGFFLFCLAIRWVRKQVALKAKAIEAADAEAARSHADQERERALRAAAAAQSTPPSPPTIDQPVAPRQYARSAVVIPLKKTGTQD